jgi:nitrite reductase/ring-hydroxylating ferredoxin subunit
LTSRRAFLHETATAVAIVVLMGLGASRADAEAFPVRFASGSGDATTSVVRFPVPDADGVLIDVDHGVILVRYEHHAYAFSILCTHQPVVLEWIEDADLIECPKHHACFRLDGEHRSGRATRALDRFDVRLEGTDILVAPDRLYRQDRDPERWMAARVPV